jgi:hypothetical protein
MKNAIQVVASAEKQLALKFAKKPGRPVLGAKRRASISITIAPELVDAFDRLAYQKDMSRSRGVEEAMRAWMKGSKNGADF